MWQHAPGGVRDSRPRSKPPASAAGRGPDAVLPHTGTSVSQQKRNSTLRIALSLWTDARASVLQFSGGYVGGVTPVPIPNTEVKPSRADGTPRETAWESRSLPDSFSKQTPPGVLLTRGLAWGRLPFRALCTARAARDPGRFVLALLSSSGTRQALVMLSRQTPTQEARPERHD
jgi:hypothetical protein